MQIISRVQIAAFVSSSNNLHDSRGSLAFKGAMKIHQALSFALAAVFFCLGLPESDAAKKMPLLQRKWASVIDDTSYKFPSYPGHKGRYVKGDSRLL